MKTRTVAYASHASSPTAVRRGGHHQASVRRVRAAMLARPGDAVPYVAVVWATAPPRVVGMGPAASSHVSGRFPMPAGRDPDDTARTEPGGEGSSGRDDTARTEPGG